MKRAFCLMVVASLMTVTVGALIPALASAANAPTAAVPPGQPKKGYGSTQGYISCGYTKRAQGCSWLGTGVQCFVPNKLKNGTKAPVVVFLHGFKIIWPDFYLDFIKHLTNQGYIVIFPNCNVGSLLGSLFDIDQNVMMQRAIDNTAKGLSMVAAEADLNDLTVFGHSLGALLASCWIGSGGVHPKALVLANVSTDSSAGLPEYVKPFVKIIPIDWRTKVKAVDVPVLLLTGDRDTIAPSTQAQDMYDNLTNAPSRVLYSFQTDEYGSPSLVGNHNMSMSSSWFLPAGLMDQFFGGAGKLDAADWRYVWAALDAALDNKAGLEFKMGSWSDGTPVKPVVQVAP